MKRDLGSRKWPAALVAGTVLALGTAAFFAFDGDEDAPRPSATSTSASRDEAMSTRIFDRRGPDGGVLLGELNRPPGPGDGTPQVAPTPRQHGSAAEAFIDNQVEPRLVRMCEAGWLPRELGTDCVESVHTAGYDVTTTLDWDLTLAALKTVQDALREGEMSGCDCHNAGLVTIDPATGQVVVYVPNRDPAEREDRRIAGEIDQVTELNVAGTLFLPVTYLTWFDRLGKAPLSTLWDTNPLPLDGGAVENSHAQVETFGLISARAALAASLEVPGVQAAGAVGVGSVIDMAKALGITTVEQQFDPTWRSHPDVTYGLSVAARGANVSAMDTAYMYATIANMGRMVGTPHLAETLDPAKLPSLASATGADHDSAIRQRIQFFRGHVRLPGTRELDPIVILEVRDREGRVVFQQGTPESRELVSPSSVWLLHTILSDCSARFIFWPCGRSNADAALDFFTSDGTRVPSGVSFGQQPFPGDQGLLDMWIAGYSRNAATVVWLGHANNSAIDGRSSGVFSSRVAVILWKSWMGAYHDASTSGGAQVAQGFEDLRPANVRQEEIEFAVRDVFRPDVASAAFCASPGVTWIRAGIARESECETVVIDTRTGLSAGADTPAAYRQERTVVRLPELAPDVARAIAEQLGIPVAPP